MYVLKTIHQSCFFIMSEEIHEESTINSCLQLLDGKKDEEKIAGLLMAAKYCKPSVFLIYSHFKSIE